MHQTERRLRYDRAVGEEARRLAQNGPRSGSSGASGTTDEVGQSGVGESGGRDGNNGGGARGGDAGSGGFACHSPRSFDGGYVACASEVPPNFVFREFSEVYYSYLHRPTTGTCPNAHTYEGEPGGEGTAGAAGAGGYGWGDGCTANVDCGAPNFCAPRPTANYCDDGYGNPICQRGCVTDDDCGEQQICLCGNLLTLPGLVGACVPASCKTDADCEPDYKCASTFSDAYVLSFSCQTPEDECAGRDDCEDEYGGGGAGSLVGGTECTEGPQHRVCEPVRCAHDFGQEP